MRGTRQEPDRNAQRAADGLEAGECLKTGECTADRPLRALGSNGLRPLLPFRP